MNLNNQKRTVNIFIHILTWALLSGIPFYFWKKEVRPRHLQVTKTSW